MQPPLISVPPAELSRHALSASVVPVAEILETTVSHELGGALRLLRSAYGADADLRVVVRPEMFTHGATLAWLRGQIGPTDTHICLSDGEAVRVLPGLTNHVFFYRIGQAGCLEGILRLGRRAPDLLAGLASQINTAFPLGPGPAVVPDTTLLPPPMDGDEGLLLPFFAPRGSFERDAEQLSRQDPAVMPAAQTFTYAAVSDAALHSKSFVAGLINRIIESYTDSDEVLMIGVPEAAGVEDALIPLLSAISRYAFTLPSGIPPNVFLHVGGGAALPRRLFHGQSRLVAYEADAIWLRTGAFYAPFHHAIVLCEKHSPLRKAELATVLHALTGRIWDDVVLPDAGQTSLARYRW